MIDNQDNALPSIAVIGIACRFPESSDKRVFWQNLIDGHDCLTRGNIEDHKQSNSKHFVGKKADIKGVYNFDADFFGISEREAKYLDPQQRIGLELSWSALEDAGYSPLSASNKTGVFFSANHNTYQYLNNWLSRMWNDKDVSPSELFSAYESNCLDTISTRIAYKLNLTGPAFTILSACSSSLVCIHQACNALLLGECEVALAGSVSLNCFNEEGYVYEQGMMLSKQGVCRSFDAESDGTVFGNGGGVVVLKELNKSINDQDYIYGVIRGSAVNNDGSRKVDFMAPSVDGQVDVIREALFNAGVSPDSVQYIEAHGSGTPLGDPIEFEALSKAYGHYFSGGKKCAVGSVKTNIGHLDAAAGMAGFIKAVLALDQKLIPSSLHFTSPNPHINMKNSPFYIADRVVSWENSETPRRCAVTSLGIGGTNGHLILEEAPIMPLEQKHSLENRLPFILSAKTPKALKDYAKLLLEFIKSTHPGKLDLASVLFTLASSRANFKHKYTSQIINLEELINCLTKISDGDFEETPDAQVSLELFKNKLVQRISLPSYPFFRKRYIIDEDNVKTHYLAPLIHRNLSTINRFIFESEFTSDDYFLRDHQIQKQRILPAAVYIEMVRSAFYLLYPNEKAIEVKVIYFENPFIVHQDQSKKIFTEIETIKGEIHFSIRGKVDGELVFSKGIARASNLNTQYFQKTLQDEENTSSFTTNQVYDFFQMQEINYGPTFQVVDSCRLVSSTVFGKLSIKNGPCGPQIIDGAFQCIIAWKQGKNTYVPIQMVGVHLLEPLTRENKVVLRPKTQLNDSAWMEYSLEIFNQENILAIKIDSVIEKDISLANKTIVSETKHSKDSLSQIPEDQTVVSWDNQVEAFLNQILKDQNESSEWIYLNDEIEKIPFNSISAIKFTNALSDTFGPLPTTLIYEGRTFADIFNFIQEEYPETYKRKFKSESNKSSLPDGLVYAKPVNQSDDIAIIGLSGKYPESSNMMAFWENLCAGKNCISEIPPTRWDVEKYYSRNQNEEGKVISKWGGIIQGVDQFDPLFFRIAPREADLMDPQEKLFLMEAWKTIEDAGYTPSKLNDLTSHQVGVFVGSMYQEYQLFGAEETLEGRPIALNGTPSSIANRVSFFFDFRGPSISLDTMCSSSLSALYFACQEIKTKKIQAALVGGTNVSIHVNKYLQLSREKLLSSKGLCESFGEGGNGYVPSEGIGCILIKPLDAAIRDNDQIYGVIKSIGINHGGKTSSYTAPSVEAQSKVIHQALRDAKVSPCEVNYVEAHGTGTSLGDPIEIRGLIKGFGSEALPSQFCPIGSVKSNIGHCESAAGIAGLSKVLLQMKYRQLVPSIHSELENPSINFSKTPFYVQKRLEAWNPVDALRTACVSSFGAGGSNAHVILQEYIQ